MMGYEEKQRLLVQADALLDGRFPYFFIAEGKIGFPPDWRLNPFTGGRTNNSHWSKFSTLSSVYGDIKYVWEPGRFASAFILARAFALSGQEKYAEGFWVLVESWEQQCPPNTGAQWVCGQEMALRVMAWLFALYVLSDSPTTTPERFARLAGMIAVQVDRILGNHVYAHLQHNNHAMSEGAGIFAAGLLLPFLRDADLWVRRGYEILCKEARLLIASDGTFSQKSHNYHRLMLHNYLYALRLGELNGVEFPEDVLDRIRQAVDYLCQVLDLESGRVPNYGANDGALILPLNGCDYSDFRPVCQAGRFLFEHRRWLDPGPWDEDLFWLFGPDALVSDRSPFKQCGMKKPMGGIYTIRTKGSWAFTHCETFRERPSQADSLHVDLWWRGQNIACDAGTYLYYANEPWNNGLAGTAVHNTVCIDQRDQMDRGPRFMWINWLKARVLRFEHYDEGRIVLWEGEHNGYRRLRGPVTHRRVLLSFGDATWIVLDTLFGVGDHHYTLHWLLEDFPYELESNGDLKLHTKAGDYFMSVRALFPGEYQKRISLVRGEKDGVRGWVSRYYGQREAALSFSVDVTGYLPGRFLTLFTDSPAVVLCEQDNCMIRTNESTIELKIQEWHSASAGATLVLSRAGQARLTINL